MSTPTWPVPYYQRLMRHPVNTGDIYKGSLQNVAVNLHDMHVIEAKERLKQQGLGYVVETIENHAKTNTYLMAFNDST